MWPLFLQERREQVGELNEGWRRMVYVSLCVSSKLGRTTIVGAIRYRCTVQRTSIVVYDRWYEHSPSQSGHRE